MEKATHLGCFFCNPQDYKKKAQGTRHKEQERSKEQGPKAKKGTRLERSINLAEVSFGNHY